MEITTRHNLGDFVYPISVTKEKTWVVCGLCNGYCKVKVVGSEKEISCPDCYGRGGTTEWLGEAWNIIFDNASKVGNIKISLFTNGEKDERRCMIAKTGIGSGTLWDEKDLFSSAEEAQTECDIRNQKFNE